MCVSFQVNINILQEAILKTLILIFFRNHNFIFFFLNCTKSSQQFRTGRNETGYIIIYLWLYLYQIVIKINLDFIAFCYFSYYFTIIIQYSSIETKIIAQFFFCSMRVVKNFLNSHSFKWTFYHLKE